MKKVSNDIVLLNHVYVYGEGLNDIILLNLVYGEVL